MRRLLVFLGVIFICWTIVLFPIIVGYFFIQQEVHHLILKESSDIDESRDRENKLGQYVSAMEYQLDVISKKDAH